MDMELSEKLRKRFQISRKLTEQEIKRHEHSERMYKEIKKIYEQSLIIRRLKQ